MLINPDDYLFYLRSRHSYSFHSRSNLHMTPLEIGMYVLLAVFCAAISVFVATCIIYASRARKGQLSMDDPAATAPAMAPTAGADVVLLPRTAVGPTPPLLPPPALLPAAPSMLDQLWNLFQKKKGHYDDNGKPKRKWKWKRKRKRILEYRTGLNVLIG